jgi:hypothetical protein
LFTDGGSSPRSSLPYLAGLGFYGPPIYCIRDNGPRLVAAIVSTAVTVHLLAGALVVANLPPSIAASVCRS